jgi:hypothetical protein
MARVEHRKIANIDRGLFLVRYAAAEDEIRPPKVTVAVDPKWKMDVSISGQTFWFMKELFVVLHPNHANAVLLQPGSALVVRATSPGQLIVEVTPSQRDGSSAAIVKIAPLTQGEAISMPKPATEGAVAGSGIRILGHVAGNGDVFVGAEEWLAGPSAPSRIEGIAIEWPEKPNDLNIRYSVKTAKPQASSGRMMDLGIYAGTRGRALPIVGVVVEISGLGASRYEISAEAVFLGSPRLRAAGKRVVLAGPTGREPLVGFRLRMEELNTKPEPAPSPVRSGRSTGHVRVFHSRAQSPSSLAT